ncbi:MAG: TonB-dependent receptor [Sphingomonas sp. SCN 67-18]|uniref:TonB-dependent receptor n=1 Tax=uncultured Sphingomonas sp. TaxID=158754 RepID=UPI00086D90D8|nr:TonB-dependent receptor [Sphingomonas sp. SCN 67-18]ODU22521.1 MAG: TonB-dependent receptor [Sphingomonas sp. SCN 67-18]
MTTRSILTRSASFTALMTGLFLAGAAHGQSSAPADSATGDDDVIVVTGIRASQAASIDAKRELGVIADVISAEDIGKFPDKNVAESLQRIPGIVINREFGEGERVSLRGTAANLTKTLLNGHSVATADWFILDQLNATRSFNYLILPSDIVGQLEVYKSPQADVEEGGVGGTINVRTRNPLDLKAFTATGSIQGVYSERSKKFDPQASALFSWKNADETFGILVSGLYQKRQTRRDGVETLGYQAYTLAGQSVQIPTLIGSALFQQNRERYGGNIGIQFRPSDALEVNLTGLYSRFNANNFNLNYLAWAGRALGDGGTVANPVVENGTLVAGTVTSLPDSRGVVYDAISRQSLAETKSADLDIKYRPMDATTLHLKAGWTKARGNTVNESFFESAAPGSFSFDLRTQAPSVTILSPDATSPAGMGIDFGRKPTVRSSDEEKYLYADIEQTVDWGPVNALQFGVKYTDHDRSALWLSTNGGVFVPGLTCGSAPCTVADFSAGASTPSDFLKNIASGGTLRDYWMVDQATLERIYAAQPDANRARFLVASATFSINEKAYGGYGMAKFGGDGWKGNVGVRVVRTDQTANGNLLGAPNPTNTSPFGDYTPITIKSSYTDVLPSANLSVDLSDQMVLRFAAGRTVARPDFAKIAPGVNLNGTTLSGSGGNPALKPFRANQYDVSFEWYPDRQTIVAAALFYKDILSYIVNQTTTESFPTQFDVIGTQPASCTPIAGGNPNLFSCPYDINRPSNGQGGTNKGIELQVSRPLWGGFGVIASYTYSDAKANNGDPIPDNSKHTGSLTGYFENTLLSARVSYTYRSKFFIDIDRNAPLNEHALESVDASLSVNITPNVALTADAVNLTNEKVIQYSGTPDRPRAIYDNGRQFYVGARFRF